MKCGEYVVAQFYMRSYQATCMWSKYLVNDDFEVFKLRYNFIQSVVSPTWYSNIHSKNVSSYIFTSPMISQPFRFRYHFLRSMVSPRWYSNIRPYKISPLYISLLYQRWFRSLLSLAIIFVEVWWVGRDIETYIPYKIS